MNYRTNLFSTYSLNYDLLFFSVTTVFPHGIYDLKYITALTPLIRLDTLTSVFIISEYTVRTDPVSQPRIPTAYPERLHYGTSFGLRP
jgi:hypothetical protein